VVFRSKSDVLIKERKGRNCKQIEHITTFCTTYTVFRVPTKASSVRIFLGLLYFWHRDASVFVVPQCEIEVLNVIERHILSY
jgi:hypothetical protein